MKKSRKILPVLSLLLGAVTVQAQTQVNVAHLAPFADNETATAVSVDVNSTEVLNPVVYNQISGYLPLAPAGAAPGNTLVEIFTPPGAASSAINATFDLAADTNYTVAAIGDITNQGLTLLPLVDNTTAPAAGNIKLRIVHAAPFANTLTATEVSIRDDMGNVIGGLTNVQFGQDSGFLEVPAGTYDLQVATPDGSTTLIDIAPVDLIDGTVVTVFAIGEGVNQPLGVTAVFADGSSAPLALEGAGIQETRALVAHFAPFAEALADTAVSVNVNGDEVLTGVEFNQNSPYLPLGPAGVAPGITLLEVFAPPGTPPAAIEAMPELAANTDYTVAAIGNVSNQPLSLLALEDDLTAPAAGNVKLRVVHAAPFSSVLSETEVSIRDDDGNIIGGLANVPFGVASPFLEVPAATYDLKVATPDGSVALIDLAPVALPDGAIVTVFAVGDGLNQPLGATAVFADGTRADLPLERPTRALVAHFAPFAEDFAATAVAVEVNGNEVLNGVQFNQASGYLDLGQGGEAPGITQLDVFAPPGAVDPAISAAPNLAAETDYTVAAIGDINNQPLDLLLLTDDNTAPAAGNVKLRIVHAAPFASSLTDTAVSIRTDSGDVVGGLTNVEFGQSSPYLEIPAGNYDLQVATPDGTTTLINLAPVDLTEGTIVTVFAVGNGVEQPLGITAIFSDGTNAALALEPILINVLSEDFSGGSIPAGWNNADPSGNNALWTWCADPADDRVTAGCPQVWPDAFNLQLPFAASTSNNGFVTLDSDFYGPVNHLSELTTPSLDLSDAETVELSFQSHIGVFTIDADSNAVVRVSNDGGTTWDTYNIFPGLVTGANNPPLVRWSANPTLSTFDISKSAAGQSDVLIQWQWNGEFEYNWNLDDISVGKTVDGDLIFRNGFE